MEADAWNNVDLVRRIFMALNKGQAAAALSKMRTNVTFDTRSTWPGTSIFNGRDGLLQAFGAWFGHYHDIRHQLIELNGSADRVIQVFTEHVKETAEHPWAERTAVWVHRFAPDGLISQIATFPNRRSAFAASGMDPLPIEYVMRAINALNGGDIDTWLKQQAQNATLAPLDPPVGRAAWLGHKELREWAQRQVPAPLLHFEAVDNRVLSSDATGTATLHTVADGLIISARMFGSIDAARAAARNGGVSVNL